MTETLQNPIPWPRTDSRSIITTLVAYLSPFPTKGFINNANGEVEESQLSQKSKSGGYYSWYVSMYKPGPDARHLGGTAILYPDDVYSFINSLKEARKKMLALTNIELGGEYKKDIFCIVSKLRMTVTLNKSGVELQLWVQSGGKYTYGTFYDVAQLDQMIISLNSTFMTGNKLSKDLEMVAE
jgi:hypothetical protein